MASLNFALECSCCTTVHNSLERADTDCEGSGILARVLHASSFPETPAIIPISKSKSKTSYRVKAFVPAWVMEGESSTWTCLHVLILCLPFLFDLLVQLCLVSLYPIWTESLWP